MVAVYAGSFDCYTNEHHDIVKKASRLFDQLHIVLAVNSDKNRAYSEETMAEAIRSVLKRENITNCIVSVWYDMVAEYCNKNNIDYYVRELRNRMDYKYEDSVAHVNKLMRPEMNMIYIRSDAPAISSSMVKELHSFGKDVSSYVPPEIWQCICSGASQRQSDHS